MARTDVSDLNNYLQNKQNDSLEDLTSVDTQIEATPEEFVKKFQVDTVTDKILEQIKTSPLAQLGNDFVAEQTSKVGGQILVNAQNILAEKLSPIKTEVEKAVNLAFSTITAAITAQNNIILYMVQQLAQEIIVAIDDKEVTRAQMQESLRQLHNALAQLVAGDPFFAKYLNQLRQALRILFAAQSDILRLRNTYVTTDIFQSRRFDSIMEQLAQAEALMEPEGQQTDKPFTDSGLFANVGIPSEPQQLTLILSIPKLAKEVILATKGYFLHVAKINGLIVAFLAAIDTLKATQSDKLQNFIVSYLDSAYANIDSLTQKMALSLNGAPQAYLVPLSSHQPKPVQVSTSALGWLVEVKVIIQQLALLPKDSLKDLNLDKNLTDTYYAAVDKIKALTDIKRGDAILRVNEGQEQIGLVEQQITQFTIAALGAIVSGKIAANVLPLGRTVISYLDLSRENDLAVKNALLPFVNAQVPFFNTIKRIGDGFYSMLDRLGLDKAADMLRSGKFQDFFNISARTATYAGSALAIVSELKSCAKTTEDITTLDRAEREIKKDVQRSELLLQRSAQSALLAQRNDSVAKSEELGRLREDIKASPSECIIDGNGNYNGDAMMNRFGSVLGVNLLADQFSSKNLQGLAKGKLF